MIPKYVLYVDYTSDYEKEYDYLPLVAKTSFEAVSEAEQIYRSLRKSNIVYLVRIMEKTGKVMKHGDSDWKRQMYVARLCKRSIECGWHKNDALHGENYCEAYRYWCEPLGQVFYSAFRYKEGW